MIDVFQTGTPVTLPEVLQVKEYLAQKQQQLLTAHPQESLLSFRLNIPGPIKQNAALDQLFQKFYTAFLTQLDAQQIPYTVVEIQTSKAGNWLLLRAQTPPLTLKRLGMALETQTPLGRLCDFDVLYQKDHQLTHVHRTDVGASKRQCLICHEDAKVCGRSRKHSVSEMQHKINQLIQADQVLER